MNSLQAINLLKGLEQSLDDYCELNDEGKSAFRMAIEALSCSENPNNSDCISRQAAIDAMGRATWAINRINELPSAQPEIVRCKDCIFHGLCRTSPKWAVAPKDDWYCADAERRIDEQTV